MIAKVFLGVVTAFSLVGSCTAGEQSSAPLFMRCSSTPVDSYWEPNGRELIVVYSLAGLYADLNGRLPKKLFETLNSSSVSTLTEKTVEIASRDAEIISTRFYDNVQGALAEGIGAHKSQCARDVDVIASALDRNYQFILRKNASGDWFDLNNINELNIKNHQFAAFLSKVSKTGHCREVFSDGGYKIKVCQ